MSADTIDTILGIAVAIFSVGPIVFGFGMIVAAAIGPWMPRRR
jgi:hypothetical protein